MAKSRASLSKRTCPLEKEVQNTILHWLHLQPCVAKVWQNDSFARFKTTSIESGGLRRGFFFKRRNSNRPNGLSDILGFLTRPHGGRILALEVKSKTGKLSDDQHVFLTDVLTAGGIAGVVRSIEDVEKIFKEEGLIK